MTIKTNFSCNQATLSHDDQKHILTYTSKIPEYTEYFKIQLNGLDVTEAYYRFLQKNKITQKNWRYNKTKNHFSVGTNSGRVIFKSIEEEQLKEFILNNI